ncbi:MAG: 50S ribosomal protein L30e [Promethearchaeota archaeon]
MSYKRGNEKLKRRKRTSAKQNFDEGKELNVAVKTGKILLGARSVTREISMGSMLLIVLSHNAPAQVKDEITLLNNCLEKPIPVYNSKNSSWDLGAVCGKPFWVSVLGVLDAGDSSILKAVK